MAYSLTNTTKKKSGGSSGSKNSSTSITVTRSQREANRSGNSISRPGQTGTDGYNKNTGGQTAGGAKYNTADEFIKKLAQSLFYDKDKPKGYADPKGYYTTRQTAFTWRQPDGSLKTTYSNATNQSQALKDAVAAGQVPDGASLAYSSTYGTGSLSGNGYNYGSTSLGNGMFSGFGDGDDGGRYTSDSQYGSMYDQANMQLSFLSGRDGRDYNNPYSGLPYEGNGMSKAYQKGADFLGQGYIMGGYGADGPDMDDIYAGYGTGYPLYGGAGSVTGQLEDILSHYQDMADNSNSALSKQYKYQEDILDREAEEAARELYINKRLAERDMPQQLAARGFTGGISESGMLGLNTDYENAYRQNDQNHANVMNQLDAAKNNAIDSELYSQLAYILGLYR